MTILMVRPCTICMAHEKTVPALFVARNAEGMEWYECAVHDALDHDRTFKMGPRTMLMSKEEWFARHFPAKKESARYAISDENDRRYTSSGHPIISTTKARELVDYRRTAQCRHPRATDTPSLALNCTDCKCFLLDGQLELNF